MSLTIVNNPAQLASVSSEMLFVAEEPTKTADPVTYPNYKFILQVYVAGEVYKLKAQPHPTSGLGIFDVSKVLQIHTVNQFAMSSNKVDYTSRQDYYVKLGEEYSDTEYLGIVTDGTRYAYKSYKRRPFEESNVIGNGIASNMPSTITAVAKDSSVLYQLVPYFSDVSGITDLSITYKNAAGTTLATATLSNVGYSANTIRQFNINNAFTNADYILLTGPLSLRINLQCTKHPVRYLAWLNPYGAYDSLTFGMVSMKTTETERRQYGRLPYEVDNGGDITYQIGNVFYGQKRTFATKTKTRMKLTSHLLTDAEYTWLADLFSSTDVYMYDDTTGYWMPVQITSGNYEYRTYLNSKLKPLEFEVEFSDEYNSQFL
jgi:hypothetical protein